MTVQEYKIVTALGRYKKTLLKRFKQAIPAGEPCEKAADLHRHGCGCTAKYTKQALRTWRRCM